MIPIFIPTKGRYENCKTASLLKDEKNVYLVVEPKEEKNYKNGNYKGQIIVLPFNDKGITYVRNFILNYCFYNKIEWFWMMDDDINNFYTREGTKLTKKNNAFRNAEQFICENTAQISLEYQQFAWSATKNFVQNSYNDVCVCINSFKAKKTQTQYREYVSLKEDRDFTMQLIKNNFLVKRVTTCAFSAPKNGSNKGGLKQIYDQKGREETASKRMVEIWGDRICRFLVKKDGRPDVKIYWKEINSKQQSLF